jgi:hypothetical protein
MIGEVDVSGVFVPVALVAGLSAFGITLVLRRVLRAADAYTFIWHAGLFDVAMFVVVWWLVAGIGAATWGQSR